MLMLVLFFPPGEKTGMPDVGHFCSVQEIAFYALCKHKDIVFLTELVR